MDRRDAFYIHIGGRPTPRLTENAITGAPEAMDGLRILFASDLHVRARHSMRSLLRLRDGILRAGCELIVLGGDYAEDERAAERLVRAFSGIAAPLGVYAVAGNNDRRLGENLSRMLNAFGAQLLRNESVRIPRGGGIIELGGVDDHIWGQPDYDRTFPLPHADHYRILASHFPCFPAGGDEPDLILSGHTHGGQVRILGLNPYSLGIEDRYLSRARKELGEINLSPALLFGEINADDTHMIVSRGVGMSRIPLRVGCPAEMQVVSLRAGH